MVVACFEGLIESDYSEWFSNL